MCIFFFFFKHKTAYEMRISDWSSYVCSSDLHALVALGVLVHEGALKHPGDDLHVTVRMGLEAHPRRHHVVVADEQEAVVGVVGVVVLVEGDGVLRSQQTDSGLEAVISTRDSTLGAAVVVIAVIRRAPVSAS